MELGINSFQFPFFDFFQKFEAFLLQIGLMHIFSVNIDVLLLEIAKFQHLFSLQNPLLILGKLFLDFLRFTILSSIFLDISVYLWILGVFPVS